MARILVVGPGRVGTTFAIALKKAHHTIIGAVGKTEASESSKRFRAFGLGETICLDDTNKLSDMVSQTDIMLLCVRDREIPQLAEYLANNQRFRSDQLACHMSGATGLDTLRPLLHAGAMVGSLHPLQTFADPMLSASKLKDTYFAITGNDYVASILCDFVKSLGAKPFILPDKEKTRYHAGAALASNALVALIYTALSLMPDGCKLNALFPLIEGTIENLRQVGIPDALTGPIERGDIQTVLNHLEALAPNKEARLVYKALGTQTVTVASLKGSINQETKSNLLMALQNSGEEESFMSRITVKSLLQMKQKGVKIAMMTAYDFPTASILDKAGMHILLVGDSLGMVVQGNDTTLPVTLSHMIYHTSLVSRAAKQAMVVADMPFMTASVSVEETIRNAARLMQESGCQAVKIEGGKEIAESVSRLVQAGIPVMGHIGLTPQSVHAFGGFSVQGRTEQTALRMMKDALALQKAGAFAIVLEAVPEEVADIITSRLTIPTIGIGAGVYCDGQVLVFHDMVGYTSGYIPKHNKRYLNMAELIESAAKSYIEEVQNAQFPGKEQTVHLREEEASVIDAMKKEE